MSPAKIKTWYAVHKWTSLICTLFLLVICLTGLPLMFQDEISHLFRDGRAPASLPADTPRASLDSVTSGLDGTALRHRHRLGRRRCPHRGAGAPPSGWRERACGMNPRRFDFVWGMPVLLALVTLFGLLAALLGTGVWR